MADQQVHEMISAFASGCIDKENYRNFREYINTGSELPFKEMGEIQNIVSLIPVILEKETPDPELKGKVARRLKSYQPEIKAKIREKKSHTAEVEEHRKINTQQIKKTIESDAHKISKPDAFSFGIDVKEPTAIKYKSQDDDSRYDVVGQTKEFDEPLLFNQSGDSQQQKIKKPFFTTGGILFSITLLAAVIVVYFTFNDKVKTLSGTVLNLQAEVVQLKNKQSESDKFINDYKKLINFISYGDISIVKMESSNNNIDASAKLLLSFQTGEALLELNDLPQPKQDSIYRLWMIGKDASYAIGSFVPNGKEKFIKIDGMPFINKDNINLFRLTIEADNSSETAEGRMILFGTLKK